MSDKLCDFIVVNTECMTVHICIIYIYMCVATVLYYNSNKKHLEA